MRAFGNIFSRACFFCHLLEKWERFASVLKARARYAMRKFPEKLWQQ